MKTHPPARMPFVTSSKTAGPIALAIVLLATGLLGAAEPQQVWLLSTRHISSCWERALSQSPTYSQLGPDGRWISSDEAAFQATDDPNVPTCIFLHGNRESSSSAIQTGMTTYRQLVACHPDQPVRFVIWSWPSQRVCKKLRADLQSKAARTDREAFLLANCIDRMQPGVRVNLIGYSFGARAAAGALELLAGGDVAGYGLPARERSGRRPLRAILAAAAMANDWLLPGHREGLALSQVDSLLVTQNSCDPALRWYPLLYGHGGPQALGYTGPACPSWLGEDREKLDLIGVSCSVGKSHAWPHYLCSGILKAKMRQYVFAEPTQQASQAEATEALATLD